MENRRLKENKMLAICFSSYDKCLMFLLCNITLKSDFFFSVLLNLDSISNPQTKPACLFHLYIGKNVMY